MSFSLSFITRERRCGPAITRSTASSRARLSMSCAFERAVSSAASFSTFARSAPVKPGRLAGEHLEVDALGERLALRVHLEDALAALEVGRVDADLAVEAAGTQQRGVEDVGTVRRRDEDDVRLRVEAVHLDEELVQRLLALVVPAAEAGAAVAADRVDLVDEDDGRRVLLGLVEEVAHAARADAHEHLDEVGTGDRVERHARLTGDGAREERLAGSGRAVEQHALGDARADGLELGGLLQELLDLVELLDRLVGAGDVVEGDLRALLGDELGLGLAELHDAVAAALHAREHDPEEEADEHERQQDAEHREEPVRLRHLVVEAVLGVRRVDRVDDVLAARRDVVELHLLAELVVGLGEREVDAVLTVDDLGRRRPCRRCRSSRPSCVDTSLNPEAVMRLDPIHTATMASRM